MATTTVSEPETSVLLPRSYRNAGIADLPFVRWTEDHTIDCWHVPPIDDPWSALQVGAANAAHFVAFLRDNEYLATTVCYLRLITGAMRRVPNFRAEASSSTGFFLHLQRLIARNAAGADLFAGIDDHTTKKGGSNHG